jgi:MFS transporter, PHS family, inorganic phosphate transporter
MDSFADAYDLFAVNFVNVLMGYVYYPDSMILPGTVDLSMKMASSVGTVLGQVGFGVLNDIYGRKKVMTFPVFVFDDRCTEWN